MRATPRSTIAPRIAVDRTAPWRAVLRTSQWVPQPPALVFPFFANPYNLETITPPWLRFSVRSMSTPQICEGSEIDYGLSLYGLPFRWRSRIEQWVPGRHFTDTQVRGPYAHWHHLHTFVPDIGGTRLADTVTFALPFRRLGAWLAGATVHRELTSIFAFRARAIAAHFREEGLDCG